MNRLRPSSNLAVRYGNRHQDEKLSDEESLRQYNLQFANDTAETACKRKKFDQRVMDDHFCKQCKVEYQINRLESIYYCPMCGQEKRFQAYMFNYLDKDNMNNMKPPSEINLTHLRNYLTQYTNSFPAFSDKLIAHCVKELRKIRSYNRQKAVNAIIRRMLPKKNSKMMAELEIADVHLDAIERLVRTLRGDPIPEITPVQMEEIMQAKLAHNKLAPSRNHGTFTHSVTRDLGLPIHILFPSPKLN